MIDHVVSAFRLDSLRLFDVRLRLQIRLALLEGRLREGEKLVERRLARQFAASLTAVGEALILGHMFAVRRLLAGEAVERVGSFASPQDIAELEQRFFDLLAAARSPDRRHRLASEAADH